MNNRSKNIAVIGLGSMGFGIAQSLIRAEHVVYGRDVVEATVEKLADEGGRTGDVASFGPALDIAVIVVLNAAQAESVLFGDDGIVQHMSPGSCVISAVTVAPEFAQDMEARCAELGILYLDAPISGGSVKAAGGQLSIMASGTPEAFSAAAAALDAMAATVFKMGDEAGPGSAMKSVNQLLAGVHIATMGEAITFGIKQGIAADKIVEVITQSAGNSWMFENRAPHVAAGDYTPHSAVDIWLKDLGIILDIARAEKFSAPITAAALQQFVAASGSGYGREDDAAVAKVYAGNAGINLPGTV